MKVFFGIKRFWQIPRREKQLFFEAVYFLLLYKWQKRQKAFKELVLLLGKLNAEAVGVEAQDEAFYGHLRRALSRAMKALPVDMKCYEQALAAKRMSRRRQQPLTVYFGVKKEGAEELKAHAWTQWENRFVTGKTGHKQYEIVAFYN